MRKVRSRLKNGGASLMVVSAAALFLALCVCILLTNHVVPRYGLRVRPAESHFVMGAYDRDNTRIVSVAAGKEPRVYLESRLVSGGIQGFKTMLADWAKVEKKPAKITVVLVVDRAVPSGVVQELTDAILLHGFNCCYSGVPTMY